ncbi:hypothetical protein RF11_11728 [Thelohanellus kitauei]|uniref:Dolichyl-diphosphooligosaccharide--protein glycosyltransferase subunit 2 n=1 Tax=Thelohanellus kitauei TaxID=669202 RepID=A0A0C2MWB9_THEKT|nr:hypothetical protein RF11_11728 [Thelohanellus kitauei]
MRFLHLFFFVAIYGSSCDFPSISQLKELVIQRGLNGAISSKETLGLVSLAGLISREEPFKPEELRSLCRMIKSINISDEEPNPETLFYYFDALKVLKCPDVPTDERLVHLLLKGGHTVQSTYYLSKIRALSLSDKLNSALKDIKISPSPSDDPTQNAFKVFALCDLGMFKNVDTKSFSIQSIFKNGVLAVDDFKVLLYMLYSHKCYPEILTESEVQASVKLLFSQSFYEFEHLKLFVPTFIQLYKEFTVPKIFVGKMVSENNKNVAYLRAIDQFTHKGVNYADSSISKVTCDSEALNSKDYATTAHQGVISVSVAAKYQTCQFDIE